MRISTILALATLGAFVLAPEGRTDPLHKVGAEGAWQHEGSGWIFPKRIGASDRIGVPYTIDGNDDVGVQYVIPADEGNATATVEIYRRDSAAAGAELGEPATVQPFTAAERIGVKAGFSPQESARMTVYHFKTNDWIIVIRALSSSTTVIDAQLDAFVRALPWNTLGSDTSALHEHGS